MSSVHHHGHEHEFEPEYGLPEQLPSGERILWQAGPSARLIFWSVFRGRLLLAYFGLMLLLRGSFMYTDTGSVAQTAAAVSWLGLLFLVALGLFAWLSLLIAKTTVYTITDKRLVMRIGIVLNLSFNIPLRRIQAADVRRLANGTGEIAISLHPDDKIAYPHLWPHARPWHLANPQPMLRGLPKVGPVASLFEAAWRAQQSPSAQVSQVQGHASSDGAAHAPQSGSVSSPALQTELAS
ncbi:MAG: photosynthetic complex putative assembly protein PuhB [Burkholderiaceae bacterium]|jgi:hypothetical protein